jgi:hypothetical protein
MNDIASLFPADLDLGQSVNVSDRALAHPIGRGGRRYRKTPRPRRPSTYAILAELRRLLTEQGGTLSRGLRQIESVALAQAESLSDIAETLERVQARLVRIERAVFLVEVPTVPKHSRRRPLT